MGMNAAQTRPFPSPGVFGTSTTSPVTAAAAPTGGVVTASKYVPPPPPPKPHTTLPAGPNTIRPRPAQQPYSRPMNAYYGGEGGTSLSRLSGRDWLSFAQNNV